MEVREADIWKKIFNQIAHFCGLNLTQTTNINIRIIHTTGA